MKCILLHGLGQCPADWEKTIEDIGSVLEVVCPPVYDWLPDGEASFSLLYQGLEDYCRQLHEPFVLGGLSLGAVLALQYAIEHGEKLHSLILIGAQFSMPKKLLKFQNIVFRLMPKAAFAKTGLGKSEVISLCSSMMDLDFGEDLTVIPCPTLVICGEQDKSNLPAAYELKERINNAQLLIIPRAGHELNADSPLQLAKAITACCREK